ncbi:iron(III) transport system ATP-binding protein [Prosthecobacter debontii]|uniref:Spermidine/putrescine import ATP-binding protein PotA n=1 Tax=Prosthecobacter debontii TaxID=48467 RepID=A0A1T4XQY9_9BACT|nr:ABC transporter ATP-binding protein [Prosthecobacter debontii]SKA91944.1 iron(III) transport system ATP-binding protein [Prosthecobacter debontii]
MVPISIRDLTKRFGSQTVLNRINLEIGQGELFFLLGPSGCGKTTLLRHIAGFYRPDSGRIFFGEEDVTRQPAHKRGTGMMFQSYALWPHMNVAQNVAFGLEERKRPDAEIERRVMEALELVQLGGLGSRKIGQLSGGQQQRVALARALVIHPRCLLLDEPLSNLDAKLRHEMRSEIRRICKEFGLTGIYVTHDRDEALSMADRLAVMNGGHLAQLGTPEEVYRQPASRMVAEFIGETNFIPGTVQTQSSSGHYEVKTAFTTLRARPNTDDWQPQHGEKVILSIRPESLSFNYMADSSNRFQGHIVDTTYLGANVQYLLQIENGPAIKVCEPNPRQIRHPSGEPMRAMANSDDVVMLKDE